VGKGELFKFQGLKSKKRTRLGEFTTIDLLFGVNCMKAILKIMHALCYSVILLNSGNFPETAWRAIHSRQAAHPFLHQLLHFWVQRLAVNPCTARRLKACVCAECFCVNRLAEWVVTARRRESDYRLGFSCAFGVSCSEGKRGVSLGNDWV